MNTIDKDCANVEMPPLKFHVQTPVCSNPSAKRTCIELSPCGEESSIEEKLNLAKKVEGAISNSVNALIPKLLDDIKVQIKEVINLAITEAISKVKDELMIWVKGEISHKEKKVNLKTLSESELLENYKRRDNVKILGLKETNAGQREMMETKIKKIVDISYALEAQISENDISIAHRLPSRNAGNKPVIVRFARRIKKIYLLKKKKNLINHEDLRDIKLFEDLSAARVNFLKIMRSDERIQSTWTREGTIFSFGKQTMSCTKLMGCMKVVSSWNINWMLLETVSMVFSGAQPDKWYRKMDKSAGTN